MLIETLGIMAAVFAVLFIADLWKSSAVFGLFAGIMLAIMGVAVLGDGLQILTGTLSVTDETGTLITPVYAEAPAVFGMAFKDIVGIFMLLVSLYIMVENGHKVTS